jgi:hypothetical protein
MKPIYFSALIILFFASPLVYSQTIGNDYFYSIGHDSLMIEGYGVSAFDKSTLNSGCHWKIAKMLGTATGKVLKQNIISGCTKQFETLYVATDMTLKDNDMLDEGSLIQTGPDGMVAVAVYQDGDTRHTGSFMLTVGPSSSVRLCSLEDLCTALKLKRENLEKDRVTVVKGKVSYESEPGTSIKVRTKGKNSSVLHTKTIYTHEVKIDGNDTADVIRVYEGSVEVTYEKTDAMDDEAMTKEMGKLSEDMLAGKLTAEEYMVKMTEFQNYSQNKMSLSKPTIVDEGNKCTVTKSSIKVEPLGSDEGRWWENK